MSSNLTLKTVAIHLILQIRELNCSIPKVTQSVNSTLYMQVFLISLRPSDSVERTAAGLRLVVSLRLGPLEAVPGRTLGACDV